MRKQITIPENWSEIKLSQFQELQTLKKESEDYDIDLISIMCNEDPDYIRNLDVNTYSKVLLNLSWMLKLPTKAEYKPIIEFEGEKYGLVKMSSFTNGQWISIENWMEKPWQNIHKLMSLIYRPLITAINDDFRIVEDYDTKTSEQRAELFKSLPVSDAYGAIVFFSIIEKECTKNIKEYLEIEVVTMSMKLPKMIKNSLRKKSMKRFSQGNGHGIPFFTVLLKEIYSKSKKLQN